MEKDSFSVPFKKYKKEEEHLHAFEHDYVEDVRALMLIHWHKNSQCKRGFSLVLLLKNLKKYF